MKKSALLVSVGFAALTANIAVAKDNDQGENASISAHHGDLNPFHGDLNPFHGDLSPFWGDISPFWGDLNPFFGDLDAFWGDLDAFYGDLSAFYGDLDAFYGDLDAFYGDIGAFWGDIGPFWGDLDAFWGDLAPFTNGTQNDHREVIRQLNEIFDRAESVFGDAVENQTGQGFRNGFLNPFLEQYGIDLTDPESVGALDAATRSRFFIEFYDGLMGFSGRDHVDHWMPMINWTPKVSQDAKGGKLVNVGLLDTGTLDPVLLGNLKDTYGYLTYSQSHGNAVAGLIAGLHDGTGVMGVAPDAKVTIYNPFDDTMTTNWQEISDGIQQLYGKNHASIINMSLGVSGYTLHPEWANILSDKSVRRTIKDNIVLVKAAGNDGSAQSLDIDFSDTDAFKQLLIVGSVGPNGEISSFSNRPGTACIIVDGVCEENNLLMNRFLVAPGELVLVSDGEGGVTRASGTSFAAPLVTGAVALLHSRWEWLQGYAVESADIILQSAQDLGDPGVDAVYGWGLLDVEASQAPLDPNNLVVMDGNTKKKDLNKMGLVYQGHQPFASGETILAIENIGKTYRDFNILVSSLDASVSDPSVKKNNATQNYLNEMATAPKTSNGKGKGKGKGKKKLRGFTDVRSTSTDLYRTRDASLSITISDSPQTDSDYRPAFNKQADVTYRNNVKRVTLRMGVGQGAMALGGQNNFSMTSDYDVSTGGVNPALGLASGGMYGNATFDLDTKLALRVGFTQRTDQHLYTDADSGANLNRYDDIASYRAAAINLGFDYTPSDSTEIKVSYTRLQEATGLLGTQGSGGLGLEGGAWTDAITFGAEKYLSRGLTLYGSATLSRTDANDFDESLLSVSDGGIINTAWELAATKQQVFDKTDLMRVSISQPLYAEDGSLQITSQQVVNRETGELATVTDVLNFSPERRYVLEMMYARPIFKNRATLNAFGRVSNQKFAGSSTDGDLSLGARIDYEF